MDLPEEMIVHIISWLPVKSLVRFTTVSKRWRSIILFDKQFENQLRRNKILTRRLLVCRNPVYDWEEWDPPRIKSVDLETSLFRALNFSFPLMYDSDYYASLLGSCNGLVFIAYANVLYVYNPLTGSVKELPLPGHDPLNLSTVNAYVGYLPATDDYKVIVLYDLDPECVISLYEIISLKDEIWRRIEGPGEDIILRNGSLVNEALHCVNIPVDASEMIAFDLAKEEFWKMPLPNYHQDGKHENFLGVCFNGCLCLLRYPYYDHPVLLRNPYYDHSALLRNPYYDHSHSVEFWIMREYQVTESWTKLYQLRFSNPQRELVMSPLLITENYTVAKLYTGNKVSWIRISHKQEGEKELSFDVLHVNEEGEEEPSFGSLDGRTWSEVIEYEESLVATMGLKNHHKSSQS